MLIGSLSLMSEPEIFFNEGKYSVSEESLIDWANCLNSPWSNTCENYKIERNHIKNLTKDVPYNQKWKCQYSVIGYDGITSCLYGYGSTPDESLRNCIALFKEIQAKYNPEDNSF